MEVLATNSNFRAGQGSILAILRMQGVPQMSGGSV
jgi:hypothetical protein